MLGTFPKMDSPPGSRTQSAGKRNSEWARNCYGLPDAEYIHDHESLPYSDRHTVLVNSDDQPVAVLRHASVKVTRPGLGTWQHVLHEGEGYTHKSFCTSKSARQALDDPDFKSITRAQLCWRLLYRGHGRELKAQRRSTTFATWVRLHRRAMSCHRV